MSSSNPLKGRRIVITRNRSAASRLGQRLVDLGAEVLELPLIDVKADLDRDRAADVFKEFASYEWLVFTSRNGVRHFFNRFLEVFKDLRSLGFIRIAVIGQGTAEALAEFYLKPDLIPVDSTAEGLLDALKKEQTIDNLRILVIRGNLNRPELTKGLEQAGAIVDELRVYHTETVDLKGMAEAAEFRSKGADALVFASSSAVKAFGEQAAHLKLEKSARVPALCSFGPITSQTMKASGIPVSVESPKPDADTLAKQLVTYFKDR
jgi:uroporphyrinogen-III synthase